MREYQITLNGTKTRVQLSDADAKRRGLAHDDAIKAEPAPPKNKARTAPERTKTDG